MKPKPLERVAAWLAMTIMLAWCGCATPPPPEPEQIDAAAVYALVTRVLSDACTKRETDDFLIAHVDFLLKACRGSVTHCVRHVCVKLGEEDDPESSTGALR